MSRAPRQLSAQDRATLAEFEALHEQWRLADEAADAAERELAEMFEQHVQGRGPAPSPAQIEQPVLLRLAAAEIHGRSMQLLRSAPI
jgi:hypothetical protein